MPLPASAPAAILICVASVTICGRSPLDKTDKTHFILSHAHSNPFENLRAPRCQPWTKSPSFAPRIDFREIVTKLAPTHCFVRQRSHQRPLACISGSESSAFFDLRACFGFRICGSLAPSRLGVRLSPHPCTKNSPRESHQSLNLGHQNLMFLGNPAKTLRLIFQSLRLEK